MAATEPADFHQPQVQNINGCFLQPDVLKTWRLETGRFETCRFVGVPVMMVDTFGVPHKGKGLEVAQAILIVVLFGFAHLLPPASFCISRLHQKKETLGYNM
jgi:hypothetical protein